MAKVLVINSYTAKENLQYIGDWVDIFSDDKSFPDNIYQQFTIIHVNGTVEGVQAKLEQIKPRIDKAYFWPSEYGFDDKYHWEKPDVPDGVPIEKILVYRVEGSNKWYQLVAEFRFPINISVLTPEELQLLETVNLDNPSVDSFIRKIVKDLTTQIGNNIEIKELRNTNSGRYN